MKCEKNRRAQGKTQIHIIPGLRDGSVGHALATESLSSISRTHTKVKKGRVAAGILELQVGCTSPAVRWYS